MTRDDIVAEMERIIDSATESDDRGVPDRYGRDDLHKYMDGAAERYLGYSFDRLLVRKTDHKGEPFVIELYHFAAPSDAYGIWSTDSAGERVGIGQGSAYGAGLVQFWRGSYFARVYHSKYDPNAREAVLGIGRALANAIPGDAERPALLAELPTEGIRGDPVFFHEQPTLNYLYYLSDENLLHLGPKADAVFAEYREGEANAKLLLVRYRAGKVTQAREAFIKRYLEKQPQPGPEVAQLENKLWTGIAEPDDRRLRIVLDATTRDLALKLLKPRVSE
jgi:hypothetical protein